MKTVAVEHLEALLSKWDARLAEQVNEFARLPQGHEKEIARFRFLTTVQCITELEELVKEAV